MQPREADKPETTRGPSGQGAPVTRLAGATRGAAHAPAPRSPQPPPAVVGPPDALSLLRALRRRWTLALSLALIGAAVAGATLWVLIPAKYIAYGTIQVGGREGTMGPIYAPNDLKMVLETQKSRFKSRDVLLKALQKEEVRRLGIVQRHPNPLSVLTWLDEEIKVDTQENSEIMQISMTGEEAEELVVLVNALTTSYLGIVNGKEKDERRRRIEKVQIIAKGLKDELQKKIELRRAEFKGDGSPNSPERTLKQSALMAQLNEALKQLGGVELDLERLSSRIAAHTAGKKTITVDDIPDTALENMLRGDSVIKPKLDSITKLEMAFNRFDEHVRKDDPTYISIVSKLTKLRKQVDEHRERLRADLLKRYSEKVDNDHKAVQEAYKGEKDPLLVHHKKLKERVEFLTRETENYGNSNAKLDVLNVEIYQLEKQLADVDKQAKQLEVEQEAELRVALCQDAVWQPHNGRKRTIFILLGPLFVIGATCLGVAWLEFRTRRIHSTDEVARGLGMRVVGTVPARKTKDSGAVLMGGAEGEFDHGLVESIDGVRTLLLRGAGEGTSVVMVTSAVGGEGKTSLASNLALSLARAGRRTLLVDGDLRRPALHQLFEQTLQPGLSEAILAEVELADAVRPTTTDENLWLLPAGQWDREVIQELAREGAAEVFGRLRAEFDFVIVDSHPVLPANDALLMGQHADAVILSLMRGVSQAPRIYQATEKLADVGVRVFGAVVIAVDSEEYGRRYEYSAAAA